MEEHQWQSFFIVLFQSEVNWLRINSVTNTDHAFTLNRKTAIKVIISDTTRPFTAHFVSIHDGVLNEIPIRAPRLAYLLK